MKLNVLYFTYVGIGSENNGGAICCRNHIKRLSLDPEIELFVIIAGFKRDEDQTLSYLNSLNVPHKFVAFREGNAQAHITLWQKFAITPFKKFALNQPHIDPIIIESMKLKESEFLLIDYLFSAFLCPLAIKKASKKLLVTLNRETQFYGEKQKKTAEPWIKKKSKLGKMWLDEKSVFRSMDKIIALSQPDVPKRKGLHITPYLDSKNKQWQLNSSRTIFFVGNIEHYPNAEALEYILTKLAPAVTALLPDVRFKIIGASVNDLTFHHPSVDLLGSANAHDVERLFLSCHLFICPIKNTFGLKFKLAEALSYGTPFLASPESMLCLPYLKNLPTIPLDNPLQAAINIASIMLDESSTANLAANIQVQHRQFITSQHNIWSRSIRTL